jgi:glycerophosphoryl diester phosphodiesterase
MAAKIEIIAHRGASHDAPENTIAAVNLAWRQKADAVEVDVQFSKDGRLVVIHDHTTRRTGEKNKKVSEQTLAELRLLDVGRWKGALWSGERIPTLEEVLATVPSGKRLLVELKCGPDGIPEFARIARSCPTQPAPVVAIGFFRQTMKQLKAELPELEVCWIRRFRRSWRTGRWSPAAEELIAAVKDAGLDGVDLDASGPVTLTLVNKLKAAGMKVYVWTVDSLDKARKLAAAGVDGITTNRPQRLRQKLAE